MRLALIATVVLAFAAPAAAGETEACQAPYHGHRIDLDVKDADLADVLRFLADAGAASIVIGDDVRGAVTVRLHKVPWDQALCTVARLRRLEVTRDGDVYLVRARP